MIRALLRELVRGATQSAEPLPDTPPSETPGGIAYDADRLIARSLRKLDEKDES